MAPPRLLLLLPQLPQDPASGAARTALTAAQMARDAGYSVRVLATTASEAGHAFDAAAHLRAAGLLVEQRPAKGGGPNVLRLHQRGIDHMLLDTGGHPAHVWSGANDAAFDRLFELELRRHPPDLILTYGADVPEQRRLLRARAKGVAVLLCIFNLGYFVPGLPRVCDAVLTPSEHLARLYLDRIGLASTPLPTPLDMDDVLAPVREPVFTTLVNPSVEKGLFFYARLAEEMGLHHPDIPLLVVQARGTAGQLQAAGLRGGFDLSRHSSLMVAPPVPRPRDLYANTRVLLVPSLFDASGRVVAEALVNGVVPIVSPRGGLAESTLGAGFVRPIPDSLTPEQHQPVGREAVQPWVELIHRLAHDDAFYQAESDKARAAGAHYAREALAPRYVAFFNEVLAARRAGRSLTGQAR